jgi:glycosyltransferase involved in cell wall biosynthesis
MDSKRVISRLVFIGRMHTEKRPDWFIKIAEKVHLPAVLIGDGDKFEEISRMCVDRYPFVFLLGHVLNPWSHIAHGDLLIVTSDYEGDGLVVYEALSAGIPVLLRDIPDLKRLNLSSLNYCSSIEEFADRVKKFKENYSEILPSDQIKDLLLKEREISQITSKWISILND